ncbi:SMC-Scp complex subunit ScpB [Ethanoligenens harbinense]|uniref:Chromosome segregation and condensation protein, ScpB n=1 Tax=Ethanoligenens harbinense (strain DSM 18485 / JCM 12961 / CGMCC 1.5033 / YUAN-3) TaxID=663278 RepID=E6U3P2_ETHHY|nr:SMC-Scp complex subunit ScpB [Ethanoligenens harbinense]ADU27642.1 chromosome segregation and condensation protein, ScpB [Ethanoligenens harbinense YUAN-3]AVQ96678.1 SMC-Scp complex subunit ScpB [Ethanoligenens harbinense YUAN-3]AYF39338.1 SMC-Scp complex subunit ScpB [Ethanoligenens harbinense]AYF42163.1 SMC-Scp complex subunit ScpB [Ethanoligenens harbinense]QCN92918.1 SMC-Scp complex subunit ScpB [Ethanoligenens harbinense]
MGVTDLAKLEAVLFASGEPVPVARLAAALEADVPAVWKLADALEKALAKSGVCLLRLEDSLQLATRAECAEAVHKALDMRRDTPLSSAAMEVLAVVAYRQPVTKSYIEQVRGVDCGGVLSSLTAKGLLDECGRLEVPGRPILYGTTANFLRCFGLSSLDDLPQTGGQGESSDQLQWSLRGET